MTIDIKASRAPWTPGDFHFGTVTDVIAVAAVVLPLCAEVDTLTADNARLREEVARLTAERNEMETQRNCEAFDKRTALVQRDNAKHCHALDLAKMVDLDSPELMTLLVDCVDAGKAEEGGPHGSCEASTSIAADCLAEWRKR